jgi:disulfide bond formation protein DsbB
VFKVAGLCETAYPPLVGISLPGWSLIGFVLAAFALASSLWRRRRAR